MRKVGWTSWFCALALLAGCGDAQVNDDSPYDDEASDAEDSGTEVAVSGSVSVALTQAPTGVRCVRVLSTGAAAGDRRKTVTTGGSTVLDLGRLPAGASTFVVSAFNVACPTGTAAFTTEATWVGDATSVELRAGEPTVIHVTLFPAGSTSVGVDFRKQIKSVFAAGASTYLRFTDDSVAGLGWISQLGIGDFGNVTMFSEAGNAQYGLQANGTVLYRGYLHFAPNGYANIATPVPGLPSGMTDLWTGADAGCARNVGGEVYCWGENRSDRFGLGSTTAITAARVMPALRDAVKMAIGYNHACAIMRDGRAVCAGLGINGQTGSGGTYNNSSFYDVQNFRGAVDLATHSYATCGVRANGDVLCWGGHFWGSLGDGSTAIRPYPGRVPLPGFAVQVVAGQTHFCARLKTGEVYCWGGNSTGQVGDGTGLDQSYPQRVVGLEGKVVQLGAGGSHNCALLEDRSLWCWGDNSYGQLMDGSTVARFVATPAQW